MENGETGLLGVLAVQHAEEELRPETGPVQIQPLTMEVLPVWVHHLTSRTAPPRNAQLVIISTTFKANIQILHKI